MAENATTLRDVTGRHVEGSSVTFKKRRGGANEANETHWLRVLRAAAPDAEEIGETESSFTLAYDLWRRAGIPTPPDCEPEILDLFRSRHSAISQLIGVAAQRVEIECIGHVGTEELSFVMSVDGDRIGDSPNPIPFGTDGSGVQHALVPCAFVAHEKLCAWNTRGHSTRAEQILFLAELREHLERSTLALAESSAPFAFELEEHLREFQVERPGQMALGWRPQNNANVFDLHLEELRDDGTRAPIPLEKLDKDAPIIALSATKHLLLDADTAAVARAIRPQRNRLRKHVESHFHSPASLLPEGVSLDRIDLSAYSPRVVGFAPIIKAERPFDIRSSGVEWYQNDRNPGTAFLRLVIAQPSGGEIETLEIGSIDEAERAIQDLSMALKRGSAEIVNIGGRRVQATPALLERLVDDVAAFRARDSSSTQEKDVRAPTTKRLAAVIADEAPAASAARGSAVNPVPWPLLPALLEDGFELKDHQRKGIEWLWNHYKRGTAGVLLADDMGLGKTLQIACFLALQRSADPTVKRPNLIVAPVILLENWQLELQKFFKPHVFHSLILLYGDALRLRTKGKVLDVSSLAQVAYVLTNYETLQSHQQSLLLLDWNVVVLDESQAIKNPDTYRARAARGLKRSFGICSTGTPVENRLTDLWALYDFMSPGDPFSTIGDFERAYEHDLAEGIPKVRAALGYPGSSSSLLRRTKAEVLTLPEKFHRVHEVAMTERQVELESHVTGEAAARGGILGILQKLQMLYQHPRLLLPEADPAAGLSPERALEESPKLALCLEILNSIRAAGEKAIVFTLWTEMQTLLVDLFQASFGLRKVRIINGDPSNRRKARQFIDEFSEAQGFNVMVLSPLAAGTGLTIVAANHVVHYGRWWNPAKEDQATDRAYRIGQTKPVYVHYPLLHHPGDATVGFDVQLHALVERKRAMARDFLAPQADDSVTLADLESIQKDQL